MKKEVSVRTSPQIAATPSLLKQQLAKESGVLEKDIVGVRIVRKSIDARQRQIFLNVTALLYINEPLPKSEWVNIEYPDVSSASQVVVVGAGPAGLFAALRLIELNLRPIVLERGKDVHSRRKDIALISRQQLVDEESNYAFGEGGAGAFSDGKLYTRSTKRGNVDRILSIFCQHGANPSILSDVHPHIGTDCLPKVIESMRNTIIKQGGEVHFQTKVTGLLLRNQRAEGVITSDGTEYKGPVILATGHSARDVYQFLNQQNVYLETKGLAIGVRLEHSSHLVDSIMYHSREGRGKYLPAAEYRMSTQVNGRGVYSFCMCPGGFVIPAASSKEQVVVNGMSPSGRNSRWSNSGMVVELRPEDLEEDSLKHFMKQAMDDEDFARLGEDYADADNPLRMMYLQEALERETWRQGGRKQMAPALRMTDFVNNRLGTDVEATSYTPGVTISPLHFWMPKLISQSLQQGFLQFGRTYHGFLTREATVLAVETRTSSPVRISRDKMQLTHVQINELYPCGEGAGYAGGIVSAAIDGERCAEAVASAR